MRQHWKEWLGARRDAIQMSAKVISLAEAAQYGDKPEQRWSVQKDGEVESHIGRSDGRFFKGIFVLISLAAREVVSWVQMMLMEASQPGQEGVVVLLKDEQGRFLVQAKAEPGNKARGCVLLAPSLQASRANLDKVHGGKRPPRAELLDEQELKWVPIPADGARFFHKTDLYAVVRCEASAIESSQNERWFTADELTEALHEGEVNPQLALVWLVAHRQ